MSDKLITRTVGKYEVVDAVSGNHEAYEERAATAQGVAKVKGKKYVEKTVITSEVEGVDNPTKIRSGSSELMVITKVKKLAAYVITVTEKSPKRFRAVFVNRMQNYCLDCLEYLVEANSIRLDSVQNKEKRKGCQHDAYLKLKMLGYISFLSLENECILKKQYEQIAMQVADCINLVVAWRKSDEQR